MTRPPSVTSKLEHGYDKTAAEAQSGRSGAGEPARARRMRAVSDLLPEVGGAAFRRFGFVQSSVVSRWREIVGARYAAVSSPESIRFPTGRRSEGVLTLVVEGAHATLMQHVAPAIVERVNAFFGYPAVARIAFRQGIVQAEKAKPRPAPPVAGPLPKDLGDSLREVADPELRACLESLARELASGDGAPVAAIPMHSPDEALEALDHAVVSCGFRAVLIPSYVVRPVPALERLDASLAQLVRLAHQRWAIEQQYEELKDELGLDHFEGRTYPGWQHHMVISAVAYAFLQNERRRPRAGPRLTFPQVRAFVQEIFTGLFLISRPRYLYWMNQAQQRSLQLRI